MPFLKNREEVMGSGEEEPTYMRKPDDDDSFDIIDAIAEDMMMAIEKKDKGLLKGALEALCEYIRDEDNKQDMVE